MAAEDPPLALPGPDAAAGAGGATALAVGGDAVKMDHLGPMISA